MENAHRIGWAWDVEFARWTSPDSTALKVQVVAEKPVGAIMEACLCAERIWKSEASNLEVRRVTRRDPVHGLALDPTPPTKGAP
jgi:hypothetical protein